MSAYWDYIASGGDSDISTWGTDADAYGDWGDPSTWVLPETDIIDTITGWLGQFGQGAVDTLAKIFTKDGKPDWRAMATAGGALLPVLTGGSSAPRPTGYQGGIPDLTAVRQAVPQTYDPNRRPGSGGQRYFTDTQYVPRAGAGDTDEARQAATDALTAAQQAAETQATGLASLNQANPLNAAPAPYVPPPPPSAPPQQAQPAYNPEYSGENVLKTVQGMLGTPRMARGGIVGLQDGGFVVPADVVSHLGNGSSRAGLAHLQKRGAVPIQGRGDGMSDSNRTMINNRQPAAVADGEAYFPPDRAQQLGGPQQLYAMMDRIRKDRTGTTKQGRQINPNKYLG